MIVEMFLTFWAKSGHKIRKIDQMAAVSAKNLQLTQGPHQ